MNINNLLPKVFVIHHFGRWLKLPVGSAVADHVPAWSRETGFESIVENMFDDDLGTFWMPIEVRAGCC